MKGTHQCHLTARLCNHHRLVTAAEQIEFHCPHVFVVDSDLRDLEPQVGRTRLVGPRVEAIHRFGHRAAEPIRTRAGLLQRFAVLRLAGAELAAQDLETGSERRSLGHAPILTQKKAARGRNPTGLAGWRPAGPADRASP